MFIEIFHNTLLFLDYMSHGYLGPTGLRYHELGNQKKYTKNSVHVKFLFENFENLRG